MNLSRRGLVLGLSGLPLLAAAPAGASSPLTFIFVEADDCEPCKRWHSTEGHWWKTSPEYRRVNTVFLRSRRIRTAYDDANWPLHLRAYRDASGSPRAVPGYFVVRNNELVMHAAGFSAWRRQVYPVLREMVATADAVRSLQARS